MDTAIEIATWRPELRGEFERLNRARLEGLRLYRALGFRDAPFPEDNPYVTADVYMALELAP